ITRFPNEGVGIAVLTNDDAFGIQFGDVIKFRLIDEVFGLDPVDWNSRSKLAVEQAQLSSAALTATPSPPNASLPFPLATVQRAYRNRGYGPDIALCAPSAVSPDCTALLANLNQTFPAELAAADLVWAWNRLTATYVALKHFDGAVFNVSAWIAMPTGNASVPFWAYDSMLEGNIAEFDVTKGKVSGFGIRGGIWIAGPGVGEPQGKTVEARSEVWFEAVGA
ncbi:hypothetical protein C8R44DRAFT_633279, partial [Mycena epipterygia]